MKPQIIYHKKGLDERNTMYLDFLNPLMRQRWRPDKVEEEYPMNIFL